MYRVSRNVKIGLHENPDSNSAKTGKELASGDTFEVDETKVVTTDVGKTHTFLHLVTGGWAFDFHPTDGTSVCELWSYKQSAKGRKRLQKELKADMKKGIASTKHEIAAADAPGNYEVLIPLKKRLDLLNSSYSKLKEIQPASNFWSGGDSDARAEKNQALLQKLDALRLAMPDSSVPTMPSVSVRPEEMAAFMNVQYDSETDAPLTEAVQRALGWSPVLNSDET
jgi:hypothetical protein